MSERLRRALAWSASRGLVPPNATHFMLWIAMWIGWLSLSEAVVRVFELPAPTLWPVLPPHVVFLRVLAIGFAVPFVAEFLMRGVLLDRLGRTVLGLSGAILVIAIGWAALHFRQGFGGALLVGFDGVILGLARVYGRSLWIPITMHAMDRWLFLYRSVTI